MRELRFAGPRRWRRIGARVMRLLCAGLLAGPAFAHAQSYSDVPGCTEGNLPGNDPRYPAAQLIVTCLPAGDARASWNGTLIVVVHGHVEPTEALALPGSDMGGRDIARALLNLGFAFATSSFHKNGYAVEQGGNDIDALVQHFKRTVAIPRQVLLLGGSQGGLIATMSVERDPLTYAGGVALCGPLGGRRRGIDYLADFSRGL